MTLPPAAYHLAAAVHLAVASANLVAFRRFAYLEHLSGVPRIVRQVFIVQNAYLVAVQVGMAGLCAFFAAELTSGAPLGAALAGFLALFWGTRVGLQLAYYDPELRRDNRALDVLFVVADGYLCAVYAAAALAPGR